jgi:hypothetical protein
MKRGVCLLVTLMLAAVVTARADVITLPAARDNTLFLDPDGLLSSGAGAGIFAGNNSVSNTRRAVVFFDVVAALPALAVVDSVELRLNVNSAPNTDPQVIAVHRALAIWGEGTSISSGGAGAASTTGDATWLHRFYPDTFWTTAGGDFDPTPSAVTIVGPLGPHVWKSATLTQDVAQWLATPAQNFGWLIQGPESAPSTVRRFDSRETDTGPQLLIYFTPIPGPIEPTTWGRVKALYR